MEVEFKTTRVISASEVVSSNPARGTR